MKKLTQKLYEANMLEQENLVCEEAAKMCFLDIAVNLHELIQMGFTPDEIDIVLNTQLDEGLDTALINTVIRR